MNKLMLKVKQLELYFSVHKFNGAQRIAFASKKNVLVDAANSEILNHKNGFVEDFF